MTLSQDFAICPWCDMEDDMWPEYPTNSSKEIDSRKCTHCEKTYLSIKTVEYITIPVCEHDKKRFGDTLQHPICCFETRKII